MRYGHLVMLPSGGVLPPDNGVVYVVLSGVVAVEYNPGLGERQEYFLGTGGVYGLFHAMTGVKGADGQPAGPPPACVRCKLCRFASCCWRHTPQRGRAYLA